MANSLTTRGAALLVLTAVTLLLLQGLPVWGADPQVAGAASQLTADPLFSAAAVKAALVLSLLGLVSMFALPLLAYRDSLVVMTASMFLGGLIMLNLMT